MTIADQQVEPSAKTTRGETLARVEAVLPVLAKNAAQAEADRALPEESWNVLLESGVMMLFVPKRFGGLQADYRTYVEVTAKVAGACGTSGWFSFILNHADWQLGMMAQSAQEAVWGVNKYDKTIVPLTPAPGFTLEKRDDGLTLGGEWPYSSGSDRAKWALLGFPIVGDNGVPDTATGLVSMSNASEIKDTWYVAGMSGTSSNTVVVDEAFIPNDWWISWTDMATRNYHTPFRDETLYRMDVPLVFHLATFPTVVGLAKAAFDLTLARITKAPKPLTYTFYTDSTTVPGTQAGMARASWLVNTAFEQACNIADAIDQRAILDEPFTPEERAKYIMQVGQGHRMCREAMDLILDAGGAGSFALVNPVQRIWRDMAVASRHGLSVPGLKEEIYGKSLLGHGDQQMTPMV